MSFRRSLAQLPRLAPRALPTARVVGLPTTRLPASTTTPRLFSTSLPAFRTAVDSKWSEGTPVSYEELKPITMNPSDKVLLIDVREPSEVALGSIPSSVNLPLQGFEKSLSLDEGDFTRTHGFHKPEKTQPIIFYCLAGVRAQTAVDLAKRAGYKYVRNYKGSYGDWQKKDAKNDD